MGNKIIRNFCIIAHIDHGKSTLADRLLQFTGTIPDRKMRDQVLDSMDLERERGITIKAQAVRMNYIAKDGVTYVLNLIDTPGHVDFNYEVSRSIAACEGALLVVDASQGIEAQTLANAFLAFDQNLKIIPVINKIDLPNADIEGAKKQIISVLGLEEEDIILASAKQGIGTEDILEAIIDRIPYPKGSIDKPLKAIIFDSFYDSFRGVIIYVRVIDGTLTNGMNIKFMSNNTTYVVDELGTLTLERKPKDTLSVGEVGYIVAGIKNISMVSMGDTITDSIISTSEPFPGYKKITPMVFSGLYPTDSTQYPLLKEALSKLKLNDASFNFDPETSEALGFGFRCGFLGLLHMEIIHERLEREFNLSLISTAPNVVYYIYMEDGEKLIIENPVKFPEKGCINRIEEPYIKATIMLPSRYIGTIMQLVQERRGIYKSIEYMDEGHAILSYEIPLAEIVLDFYDKLKSLSQGYASFDYELMGYKISDAVKVNMLINGDKVDALAFIIHKDKAYSYSRQIAEKVKEIIPRQMYEVSIQAAVGGRIIARETIKALRKNVLAKCYGGDITRKRKLLEKQKEGKKRMKQIGSVNIPQEAFMAVLKINN
ncbi:elongation factor 4 [Candidatus Desantisbacteria bacterium]|nr:elongation factor 4 [Candidatus Desantisbacteria bacterium]